MGSVQTITLGNNGLDGVPVVLQAERDNKATRWSFTPNVSPVRCKEATVRLRSALLSIDVDVRGAHVDVPVDLAPCHDLAIAWALLDIGLRDMLVVGELGLDGAIRRVGGVAQAVMVAHALCMRGIAVPKDNAREAVEVAGALSGHALEVHAFAHLAEVVASARGDHASLVAEPPSARRAASFAPDFSDVRGQDAAVEAVCAAVVAGQNLALVGPPGVGKTMIARRVPSLLAPLKTCERLEVTRPYSALGLADGLIGERPFRAPHHTISVAALVGDDKRPGELQLATHGVLFLDEAVEFTLSAIEALAHALDKMPARRRPLVIAATNPCPCGWRGSEVRECSCTAEAVKRHAARVNHVMTRLRIVATVNVVPTSLSALRSDVPSASSSVLRERHGIGAGT